MNKKPDHLSSITQSRHSAGISSYFSLPWKETNPPPRFCVGRAWPHSRHHALESSTGEIMWPELCQGQTPLWSSKLSVFYPDVKDKTKQEPTNQPTNRQLCWSACCSLFRKELVCDQQPAAIPTPATPATPASSQGPHIPVRCSHPGAQPTLPRRSAVSEHAPLPPLLSPSPGLVSRLPGRAPLPEDKTFRD